MIIIDVTLVRLKKTKEPVAIFERQDDIIQLGQMIDEVCSYSICEYADYKFKFSFGVLFHGSCPDFLTNHEDASALISQGVFFPSMLCDIDNIFVDQSIELEWIEFPNGVNCLGSGISLEQRFGAKPAKKVKQKKHVYGKRPF